GGEPDAGADAAEGAEGLLDVGTEVVERALGALADALAQLVAGDPAGVRDLRPHPAGVVFDPLERARCVTAGRLQLGAHPGGALLEASERALGLLAGRVDVLGQLVGVGRRVLEPGALLLGTDLDLEAALVGHRSPPPGE